MQFESGIDQGALRERISLTPPSFIGRKIRRARQTAGLSHDKLGAQVGRTRQHLIALEKGDHRPRPQLLIDIADATDRPVEFFVRKGAAMSPFRTNGNGRG